MENSKKCRLKYLKENTFSAKRDIKELYKEIEDNKDMIKGYSALLKIKEKNTIDFDLSKDGIKYLEERIKNSEELIIILKKYLEKDKQELKDLERNENL